MLSDGEMIQRWNMHHTASDSAPLMRKTFLVTSHSSLVTLSLIYCGAIRIPRKPLKTSDIQISNRR